LVLVTAKQVLPKLLGILRKTDPDMVEIFLKWL